MWNLVNPFGMGQLGPTAAQKRNLGILHLANINIAAGKCFTNPNFVNKNHHHNEKFNSCHFDKSGRDLKISLNSSPETTDEMKVPSSHADNSNTKTRRRNKRNRRKRRKRCANKNNCKQDLNKKEIEEMMETNVECDISLNGSDSTLHPQSLCLNDFLTETRLEESSPSDFCTIISMTPIASTFFCRPRQVSITESEDSFIVFDSGTDESTEIDSDSESNATDIEEEDLDSSCNTLPTKRVRFADDNELCEVHPMVKWSFAYHQARIGPWEKFARDRDRFSKRIRETEKTLLPIFNAGHRERIYRERFEG